jgi:putative transcriptional regulator
MPVAMPKRQPMYNELRSIRVGQRFSRQALADMVGVNVQTIGALERGHYSPSLYLALLLARALNVGIEDLFWLEKPQANQSEQPN